MATELIPTAITDKNGKQTTVRKKPVSAATASKSLAGITPTLGGTKPALRSSPKPVKPTKGQLEVKPWRPRIFGDSIDPQLKSLIEASTKSEFQSPWSPLVKISDADGYGVLSVVDKAPTAKALMGLGVTSADEAYAFMMEHDLEHLADDRTSIAQEALGRRITLDQFTHYESLFPEWRETENYLDGMEVYSNKTLGVVNAFYLGVRTGKIRLQDIKDVGIGNISKADNPYHIPEALEMITDGSAKYTAKQFGAILSACRGEFNYEHAMMNMMKNYGGDVALSIKDIPRVTNIQKLCRTDKLSATETQAAVIYADKLGSRHYIHYSYIYELHRAGVDVDFAAEKLEENPAMTPREIIGLHEGTAAAIVDGWL